MASTPTHGQVFCALFVIGAIWALYILYKRGR